MEELVRDAPAAVGAPPARFHHRLAAGPLWAHALVLAVVLLGLTAVVGGDGLFSGDEGALVAQVRTLDDTGEWSVPLPFPSVDPDGTAFPYELSTTTTTGAAPFVKHPAYPWLARPLFGIGGVAGIRLLSIVGGVAAALAAAGLARRLRPGTEVVALWATGLATPLLFDSYLLLAHTLGAALVTAALLAGLAAVDRRRAAWVPMAAVALLAAGLLRNEALLYALALAGAFAVVALRRRDRLAALVAGAAGLAAVAAKLADRALSEAVAGRADALAVPGGAGGGLAATVSGRVGAALTTTVAPSYGGAPVAGLLVVLTLAGLLAAAIVARRPRVDEGLVVVLVSISAAAALARLLLGPPSLVPGLLAACPVLAAGLVLLQRRHVVGAAGVVALTVALFAAGVLATQYADGGSGEWGGRYLALALPALVPLALLALTDAGARLAPTTRRRALGGLLVVAVATSVLSLLALRSIHGGTAAVVDQVAARAAGTDPSDGGPPVVITTAAVLPRLSWAHVPDGRWLLVDEDQLGEYAERLAAAGVERAVYVGEVPAAAEPGLMASYRVVATEAPVRGARFTVQVVEAR